MRNIISTLTLVLAIIASSFAIANEVNVFNARHYKADSELYSKFTNKTGIKVNLINHTLNFIQIVNRELIASLKRIRENKKSKIMFFQFLILIVQLVSHKHIIKSQIK